MKRNSTVLFEAWCKIFCAVIPDESGVIYIAIEWDSSILKIDLEEKWVELEFVKAHRDNIFSIKVF
jgi:hypothetical protein